MIKPFVELLPNFVMSSTLLFPLLLEWLHYNYQQSAYRSVVSGELLDVARVSVAGLLTLRKQTSGESTSRCPNR